MQLEGLMKRDMLYWGLYMEGWGDEDRPDPLSLFQHGINKVHTGEGGDALRGIYCHRP